ncbi:unnamed protein product [Macrosiphum euphorbiae]|uniref:Uncharacterized protein n=1 Tax=Macrosiphum euphorbiae TaxID=13131 RepID=A0AAV0WAG1_9HEMI|nr:unnamed protein product [Macrosiphum euphorbiae]
MPPSREGDHQRRDDGSRPPSLIGDHQRRDDGSRPPSLIGDHQRRDDGHRVTGRRQTTPTHTQVGAACHRCHPATPLQGVAVVARQID